MKILHISTIDNTGGAARVAYSLKDTYKELGHSSRMLVGYKTGDWDDVLQIPIGRIQTIINHEITNILSLQYLGYLNSFNIKKNRDFLEADIINFHNLHGGYFNPLALPGLSKLKPSVWTLHDMWAITGRCAFSYGCNKWQTGCGNCPDLNYYPASKIDTSNLLWKIKKWIYKKSDFVIVTPSKWLKNMVEKSILSDKEINLIYNGVDHRKFHPMDKDSIRKKLGLPENKLIVMFIATGGVKNPQKGGWYLFKLLKQIDTNNIFFLNIGSSDKLDKILQKQIEYKSIPYIYDENLLPEYYAASDLLIFSSAAENCPLTVLEAMACELPVIVFNTGGVPELIDHMKTGYVAEYKNSDDLKNGVELFLRDDNLREKAGILARKKVEDCFTLDQQGENYLKLYIQILDKKR